MSENNLHNLATSSLFNSIAEKQGATLVFSMYAIGDKGLIMPAQGVDKEYVRTLVKSLYDSLSDCKEQEIIVEI